jgi:indolepyruvate ferredoxin oxidoreductase
VRHFARGLHELLVIEEKQPNLESLVKDALYNHAQRPLVTGKYDERNERLLPAYGSLSADDIIPALRRRLGRRLADRLVPEPPQRAEIEPLSLGRTPFYCSGCPHNRSTEVPEGSLVAAGIGCHTMAMLMDPRRVGEISALTCMGNEGTQWIGMSDFVERNHLVQNLGDGTYFHSGQLAVQAAIAAGVSMTYKLLWNGAVAMTGGQEAQGRIPLADVARTLLAQGVARVLVTSDDVARTRREGLPAGVEIWDRSRLIEAQKELAQVSGVTLLIHDQACAAETRRARKRGLAPTPDMRVAINHRICEGCGDCGRVSGCLSVQPIDTPFGRKTAIEQTSCNLDFSCLEGDCPSFVSVSKRPAWQQRLRELFGRTPDPSDATPKNPSSQPSTEFPAPIPVPRRGGVPDEGDFAVRITGIGGTGVVTMSQVLATAAAFDGYAVRGLDQIGLSQKAGPVVSDLLLRRGPRAETNRLGVGQADLILAFDALVAASPTCLATADPERTAVVGSTTRTPTGAMITQPALSLPSAAQLRERIAEHTRADCQHWADAAAITEALFGNAVTANLFVVGMAVQAGALPIRAESIEWAIELNGVAVDANQAAFRRGRAQISEPEMLAGAAAGADPLAESPPTRENPALQAGRIARVAGNNDELGATLERLVGDLTSYQSRAFADDFLATIETVAARESAVVPGSSRLTDAVARSLHKLLAYKDEYEVARLMLDAGGMAAARALAVGELQFSWQLHPPALRALGLKRKIAVGSWAAPAVRALAAGKRLRGTVLDPFGRSRLRQLERALPAEYRAVVERLLIGLKPDRLDDAVAIAKLPLEIRGFEDLKLARANQYKQHLGEELARYERGSH